jgi:GPN-loop GTPase
MLNLTRAIDRATGYVFVPPLGAPQQAAPVGDTSTGPGPGPGPGAEPPRSALPNAYALMSSAMGPRVGLRGDVRDVQERWVDAREEWDAYERAQWREEGEALRRTAAEVEKQGKLNVRERKVSK